MPKIRSLPFIGVAALAAITTTTICFGDALGLVSAHAVGAEAAAATGSNAASEPLEALAQASPWLNPLPGGVQSLRGKVVVVNFWTYSCINSLRALPYLHAWDLRYRDKGLVVVGVHAPEFEFEKQAGNVAPALDELKIRYPNVQDNRYSAWRRFGNEGWPGFYFIDAKGQVRSYRLGEGHYDEAEQLIRKLLTEAGHDVSNVRVAPVQATGIEAQADWQNLRSPESYLGYAKAENFASPGGVERDGVHAYQPAPGLARNQWDLAGEWAVGAEYATASGPFNVIRYRFHARDLHLVLGRAANEGQTKFRVLVDGKAPGTSHGTDVDQAGWGEIKENRLYQLVRQSGAIKDRTVSVEFTGRGARAYDFTFG